jgi:hypothetical protein
MLLLTILGGVSIVLPLTAWTGGMNEEQVSIDNLRQLGMAHRNYADDWDGRQWTQTPDDLTVILEPSGTYVSDYGGYFESYTITGESHYDSIAMASSGATRSSAAARSEP